MTRRNAPGADALERRISLYSGAVVLGFVVVVLGPALIGLRTLLSVDLLTRFLPYSANGSQWTGHQICSGDTVDTVLPGIKFIRDQWVNGHLGAWQGLVGGGSPMGALPNWGMLDPLSLPYYVLPLWLAPAFVKLLELVVGGGGSYLLLRRLGCSRAPGLIAGLIFMTSGFMVEWTNWPQTRVAALIPPLFWAVERLVQRLRGGDVVLIAVVVASMVLGGFPSVTAWALELAGVYFLARLAGQYRRDRAVLLRGVLLGVSSVFIGALLAGIQLVPFARFLSASDLSVRQSYGLVPVPSRRLVTLVDPGAYGLCTGGRPTFDSANPIETVAYIGAAALILAVLGACVLPRLRLPEVVAPRTGDQPRWSVASRGGVIFFTAATLVIVVVGWTVSEPLHLLRHVPPFDGNPIGRIRSVLGFSLAVLAGFGYQALLDRHRRTDPDAEPEVEPVPDPDPDDEPVHTLDDEPARYADDASTRDDPGTYVRRRRLHWAWAVLVVVGFLLAAAYVLVLVHREAVVTNTWLLVRPTLSVPALLAAATVLLLAVAALRWRGSNLPALLIIPLLVAGQGAYYFHAVLPGDNPDNFYPVTDIHSYLHEHLGAQRYDASGQVTYPSTGLYYGLRTATGHTSLSPAWVDLVHAVEPDSSLSPTFTAFAGSLGPIDVGRSAVLDRMGVSYWVFPPENVAGPVSPAPPATGTVGFGPTGSVTCTVPGGALRGVVLRFVAPATRASSGRPSIITVTARNGTQLVTGARAVFGDVPANTDVQVALPGESFGAGATDLSLRIDGLATTTRLAATASGAACGTVRPADDRLRLVFSAAGGVIYQRLDALARVRWSGSARVVTDPVAQVAALKAGVPAQTVILGTNAGIGSGQAASIAVSSDRSGYLSARVDAQGAGYLTVADAMTAPGWSVSVDGHQARLLVGDHAMGTVAVPQGVHTVVFSYAPPGFGSGVLLTVAGILVVVAILSGGWWRRRRPLRLRRWGTRSR